MKNALFADWNLIKRWQAKGRASQNGRELSNWVLQRSVLRLILSSFIPEIEKAVNSDISKDANDTKIFFTFVWQTNSKGL